MDDSLVFGLGSIPSPSDPRDWHVSDLYALAGVDATTGAVGAGPGSESGVP